jgi:hypothetical protein
VQRTGQAEAQHDVAAIGVVLQPGIGQDQMRLQPRMLGGEGGEHGRDVISSKIGRRTDPQQPACHAAARGDFGLGIADLVQDRAAAFIEQQAFIRQAEPTGAAIRQADAQPGFERAQPAADGGGG